jgi:phytanoyl-CoA hydroxylase
MEVLDSIKPDLPRTQTARDHYETEGYVVLRGAIDPRLCDAVMENFNRDVRHSKTPILRQKEMTYEANRYTADGFLENPIFNVQDLETRRFGRFKRAALDVITDAKVTGVVSGLIGGVKAKVIQSMFFEAPAGTWAHQDSYYQDSSRGLGGAVAGWFALEDIQEGAGRFFVCPGSHRMPVVRNEGKYSIAGGHAQYKEAIAELIRSGQLQVHAPVLAKGDVLLWSSLTVHGSFSAERPGVSRQSLTAHYLRDDEEMLQFHTRVRPQRTRVENNMRVGILHDQDKLHNRLVRDLAYHFPGPYMAARRTALKALVAKRRLASMLQPKS